jgi:hypothetical protein
MKQALMLTLALVLACGVLVAPASAQRRYRSPFGPTLSPYLDFFRRDNGALGDPYNAWVRPRQNLRNELYQQQRSLYNLNRELRDVNREVQDLELLRESGAAPTGTGSRFMNFSHFYRMPSGRRR